MDLIRQLAAIAFVFGMLAVLLWGVRRKSGLRLFNRQPPAGRNVIECRGRLSLSQQHCLHCVRIGRRELLVGVHPSGITLLGDVSASDTP